MHYIEIDGKLLDGQAEKLYVCVEHIIGIDEKTTYGNESITRIYTNDGEGAYIVCGKVASELIKLCVRSTGGNAVKLDKKG